MSRTNLYLVYVATLLLFILFGCGKDIEGNNSEEQVTDIKERAEIVSSAAGDFFSNCSTIDELKKHLNDIKKIPGVKNAYISGNALFVEIEGWGKVSYLYPSKYDASIINEMEGYSQPYHKTTSQTKGDQSDLIRYSVCLADQVSHNDDYKEQASVLSSRLASMCSNVGITFVEEPMTVEWIFTKMWDYDAVILHAHGCYDNGQHWIATANEIGIEKWVENYSELGVKFESLSDSESMAMCIKETRGGKEFRVWYIALSEKAIRNIPGPGFISDNPHIVFNTACESLKNNDALADAFIHQGANYYYGFNDTNSIAPGSVWDLFRHLTKGESFEQAFETMSFLKDNKGAILICKEDGSLIASSTYILPPIIPEALDSALGQYMTINRGYNPPFVEGEFIVNPLVYLYDSSFSHYTGQRDNNPVYFRFKHQDNGSLTIEFEESASGGIEYDYGNGHIYGNGNMFTIIANGITEVTGFTIDSSLNIEDYTILGQAIWFFSGTKVGTYL